MNKMNLKNAGLFLIMIILGGCGGSGSGDSDIDGGDPSLNELGLSETDGVIGTLDGENIQFDLTDLTMTVEVIEGEKDNKVYDEDDEELSIRVVSDSANPDRISFILTIFTYTNFIQDIIYEFNGSDDFESFISLRRDSDILTSYEIISARLLFTITPTLEAEEVAGSLHLVTVDGESIKSNFNSTLTFK